MEIVNNIKIKSLPKNNPYAPEWDIIINEFRLSENFCKELKSLLEKSINLESSWKSYNIFSIDSHIITELKSNIRNILTHYEDGPWNKKLWINGWINYQTKGESVPLHLHSMHNNSYLSGTLCLDTREDVATRFHIPIVSNDPKKGPFNIPSLMGRLMMFPSYIPHEVTEIPNGNRMSIGFDLLPDESISYFKKYNNNADDPLYRATRF